MFGTERSDLPLIARRLPEPLAFTKGPPLPRSLGESFTSSLRVRKKRDEGEEILLVRRGQSRPSPFPEAGRIVPLFVKLVIKSWREFKSVEL